MTHLITYLYPITYIGFLQTQLPTQLLDIISGRPDMVLKTIPEDSKIFKKSLKRFQYPGETGTEAKNQTSYVNKPKASRWADPSKPQMTPMGYVFNFLWRFFIVFSRVFMLSLFATEFQHELFVFIGLHWLLMSLWIFMMVRFLHI